MPLTLANLRNALGRRLGALAALADLDEAIGYALRELGVTPADPYAVADSDLEAVPATSYSQLYDVAAWRGWVTIDANLDRDSLKAAGVLDDPRDVRTRATMALQTAEALVKQKYGVGLRSLEAGVLDLNFQADPCRWPPCGPCDGW